MRYASLLPIVFVCFVAGFLTIVPPLYAQEDEAEVELQPPDFVSAEYGFGVALPEGYVTFDCEDSGVWVLQLVGQFDDPTAQISVQELPEGVSDLAGFWQYMKEQDPLMARNITYEKTDSVAGTGAVQARIEQIQSDDYVLAITWVFVHEGHGFTLTGYPPEGGDNNTARDLALRLAEQFRWMNEEEIAEFESEEHEIEVPAGRQF